MDKVLIAVSFFLLFNSKLVFSLRCLSCGNNPECASGHAQGTMVSCDEVPGQDSYCYVYIKEDNTMMKGCLEYGAEKPDIMTSVWPEEMKCITVLDGDSKGVPNGHGCKCLADICNPDLCSAANTHDPPHEKREGEEKAKGESEIEGCRTINCQRCIFPFKYNGVEHEKCITVDSENGAPWCAVDLQEDGEATYGAWEDCDISDDSCPVENNGGKLIKISTILAFLSVFKINYLK